MRRFLLVALGMGLLLTKPVYSEPDKLLFVDAHSQLPNSQLSDEIIHLLNQAGIKKVILSHRRLAKNKDILTLKDVRHKTIVILKIGSFWLSRCG